MWSVWGEQGGFADMATRDDKAASKTLLFGCVTCGLFVSPECCAAESTIYTKFWLTGHLLSSEGVFGDKQENTRQSF
jgi:hypothetical protein